MSEIYHNINGRTILVTGGAGAIGGNLTKRLVELGAEKVIILDNLSSGYSWNVLDNPSVKLITGDILDEEKLKWAFRSKPSIVYHLAAHFANQNSVDNPETDLMVNGLGILKVLEYAHLGDVDRFIYASSGCGIYGSDTPMPFKEESVSINLYTPYQVTKMLGELYTNYYHNLYGLPVVNARFFNSFGPGEVPGRYRNVIPNFIFWAMNHQSLPITGTGDETRDFTYVGDIVDGLIRMAYFEEAIGEAFNLGASREIRIRDLAEWINELTGNSSGIEFKPRRSWDKKNRLLSCIDKAKNILGYQPNTEFKTGLEMTVNWFKDNHENIRNSAQF
ncbi:NAD-dependent epimerase/dehydratase family protein [archaeon]|nr:NAD-dependent epimerase/dehydratase family protein [archaeon]